MLVPLRGDRKLTGVQAIIINSCENAAPVRQVFPLIIYLCSFNGMSFGNIHLLENLATHGYITASIRSVGRFPGNMTTDPADPWE